MLFSRIVHFPHAIFRGRPDGKVPIRVLLKVIKFLRRPLL